MRYTLPRRNYGLESGEEKLGSLDWAWELDYLYLKDVVSREEGTVMVSAQLGSHPGGRVAKMAG